MPTEPSERARRGRIFRKRVAAYSISSPASSSPISVRAREALGFRKGFSEALCFGHGVQGRPQAASIEVAHSRPWAASRVFGEIGLGEVAHGGGETPGSGYGSLRIDYNVGEVTRGAVADPEAEKTAAAVRQLGDD